jgi:ribosomal protein L2
MLGVRLINQVRFRTFRYKGPPAMVKWMKRTRKTPPSNVLENKFWKVENGLKIYKNVSNGCRHRRHPTRFHLSKTSLKRLSFGKRSSGGRNGSGRITVRHRGGGHKRRIRIVDQLRRVPGPQQVVRLEYDPNRSAELCLLRCMATNEFSYIIAPDGVQPGDMVQSWATGMPPNQIKHMTIRPGNCLMLKDIPAGTIIHNLGLTPGGPGILCRAAGAYAQVVTSSSSGFAQIRLKSKEIRLIHVNAIATIGKVGNVNHHMTVLGKAAASRWRGRRPKVRGMAMNAVDHPHGGGYKHKGGGQTRSIWGWKCKGVRTVRKRKAYLVVPRWKAKMANK